MSAPLLPPGTPLADQAVDASCSAPQLLVKGFRSYERYTVTLDGPDGVPVTHTRDLLRVGRIAVVLAVDLARREVVLIHQFRLAAHLATGKGELVETIAGYVEPGEAPTDAARRECREEIGVEPGCVVELLTVLPTSGATDECATLFLAAVDAAQVPEFAGIPVG